MNLKKWLIDNGYLPADAKDDAVEAAAEKAMKAAEKSLSLAKYRELCAADAAAATDKAKQRDEFADTVATKTAKGVAEGLAPAFKSMTDTIVAALAPKPPEGEKAKPETKAKEGEEIPDDGDVSPAVKAYLDKQIKARQGDEHEHYGRQMLKMAVVMNDEKDPETIRVKRAIERFPDTKTAYKRRHGPQAGEALKWHGRDVNEITPRDDAMHAAWFKFQTHPEWLTPHDKDILCYIVEKMPFVNCDPLSAEPRPLRPDEIGEWKHRINMGLKVSLLDDTTSGGQYAVPEFFDTNAILTPVLDMELSPYVSVVEVPRGHSAINYVLGLVSVVHTAEGSTITAFDATSLIAQHNTTFFPVTVVIRMGKDLMADAQPSLGREIRAQSDQAFGSDIDEQITNGDGTTEPEGILTASGVTSVNSVFGAAGPVDILDLVNTEALVTKAYYNKYDRSRFRFITKESNYWRFRGLQTGIANDATLLFGNNPREYMLLSHDVSLPNAGITNAQLIAAQLGGYRYYRRQGVQYRVETGGITLALVNEEALVGRMRHGGRLDLPGYAGKCTSLPA